MFIDETVIFVTSVLDSPGTFVSRKTYFCCENVTVNNVTSVFAFRKCVRLNQTKKPFKNLKKHI